jgi:hypothetical protein
MKSNAGQRCPKPKAVERFFAPPAPTSRVADCFILSLPPHPSLPFSLYLSVNANTVKVRWEYRGTRDRSVESGRTLKVVS